MGEETLLLGNDLPITFAQFADDDWGVNDCDGKSRVTMLLSCQSDNNVKVPNMVTR